MGEETLLLSERAEGALMPKSPELPREGVVFQYVKVVERPDFDPTKPETYLAPQSEDEDAVERMEEITTGTTWV